MNDTLIYILYGFAVGFAFYILYGFAVGFAFYLADKYIFHFFIQ